MKNSIRAPIFVTAAIIASTLFCSLTQATETTELKVSKIPFVRLNMVDLTKFLTMPQLPGASERSLDTIRKIFKMAQFLQKEHPGDMLFHIIDDHVILIPHETAFSDYKTRMQIVAHGIARNPPANRVLGLAQEEAKQLYAQLRGGDLAGAQNTLAQLFDLQIHERDAIQPEPVLEHLNPSIHGINAAMRSVLDFTPRSDRYTILKMCGILGLDYPYLRRRLLEGNVPCTIVGKRTRLYNLSTVTTYLQSTKISQRPRFKRQASRDSVTKNEYKTFEVVSLLKISLQTMYSWMRSGIIKPISTKTLPRRFSKEEVLRIGDSMGIWIQEPDRPGPQPNLEAVQLTEDFEAVPPTEGDLFGFTSVRSHVKTVGISPRRDSVTQDKYSGTEVRKLFGITSYEVSCWRLSNKIKTCGKHGNSYFYTRKEVLRVGDSERLWRQDEPSAPPTPES